MRTDDEIRLRHMLEAAREAVSFARGRARGDLETDRQLVLSLVKDIEIVGEAAAQVTEGPRERGHRISRGRQSWPCEIASFTRTSASTSISSGRPCNKICRH